ncbi:hypothetical protein EPI10_028239 [Gossypium australe]|uniref:Aspartic peptidase DDI1-type domain-containing protein n=1 Tax=Gossypium australe TaxID=47621 RepID=A0A5B6UX98_9ROSI|nr:hypothetical protein EPI10_028239 [Gossypium australe]
MQKIFKDPQEANVEPEPEKVTKPVVEPEDKTIHLIEKVPKYAKYLKEIMSRRRKIKTGEQKLPKLKDPGSFTMPIEIGNIHFSKALCDLGANINLMLLHISEKLRLRELQYTQVTLQLAEKSSVQLKGVLEDVLVKVRRTIFIILSFEEDREIPILLVGPFLATPRSTIDLENNDLKMRINVETEIFKFGHR